MTAGPGNRPSPAPVAPTSAARLRTLLIADVRSYTRLTHQHGDEAAGQ
jgi:class 3 adenylate cyclase